MKRGNTDRKRAGDPDHLRVIRRSGTCGTDRCGQLARAVRGIETLAGVGSACTRATDGEQALRKRGVPILTVHLLSRLPYVEGYTKDSVLLGRTW